MYQFFRFLENRKYFVKIIKLFYLSCIIQIVAQCSNIPRDQVTMLKAMFAQNRRHFVQYQSVYHFKIMNKNIKKINVDFHTHTIRSDGHLSPKDLIQLLLHNQVQIFSLTDHDLLQNYQEIITILETIYKNQNLIRKFKYPTSITYIPGTELSLTQNMNEYHFALYFPDFAVSVNNCKLFYNSEGIDELYQDIQVVLDVIMKNRHDRIQQIMNYLKEQGIECDDSLHSEVFLPNFLTKINKKHMIEKLAQKFPLNGCNIEDLKNIFQKHENLNFILSACHLNVQLRNNEIENVIEDLICIGNALKNCPNVKLLIEQNRDQHDYTNLYKEVQKNGFNYCRVFKGTDYHKNRYNNMEPVEEAQIRQILNI